MNISGGVTSRGEEMSCEEGFENRQGGRVSVAQRQLVPQFTAAEDARSPRSFRLRCGSSSVTWEGGRGWCSTAQWDETRQDLFKVLNTNKRTLQAAGPVLVFVVVLVKRHADKAPPHFKVCYNNPAEWRWRKEWIEITQQQEANLSTQTRAGALPLHLQLRGKNKLMYKNIRLQ